MYLHNYDSRVRLLVDWITTAVPEGSELLDIGASDGIFTPEVDLLCERGYLIDGVDPDVPALGQNSRLRHRFPGRIEAASLPGEAYDAAFAIYVAEHVEHPDPFLAAAWRTLRPGGSLFLITPNGDHYFAWIARLTERLRLQEKVLRLLRPGELIDRYHHVAFYRMNRPRKLIAMGHSHGFDPVELRFSERVEEFDCYLPGPTKLLARAWEELVRRTGREQLLGNLMARLIKPGL
jgi:2-polyprenyl-3-methyl-5-hydroxy-6-metoxy-1,4-benzoquinol methylase